MARNPIAAIGGGLLEGLGAGMVSDANDKKEKMLLDLRYQRDQAMQQRKFGHEIQLEDTRAQNNLTRDAQKIAGESAAIDQRARHKLQEISWRSKVELGARMKILEKEGGIRKEVLKLEQEFGLERDKKRETMKLENRLAELRQLASNANQLQYIAHIDRLEEIAARGREERQAIKVRTAEQLAADLSKIDSQQKYRKELARLEKDLGIELAKEKNQLDLQNRLAVVEATAANSQDAALLAHIRKMKEIAEAGKWGIAKKQSPAGKGSGGESDSLRNSRIVNAAIKAATKDDDRPGKRGQKIVNYKVAADYARRQGSEDTAVMFDEMAQAEKDPKLWDQATRRARDEAGDKAGYFSGDASDFKEWGGSQEAFVSARALQIYNELKGAGGKSNQTPKGAPKPPTRIKNRAEWEKLESGTLFIGPDGKTRRKP